MGREPLKRLSVLSWPAVVVVLMGSVWLSVPGLSGAESNEVGKPGNLTSKSGESGVELSWNAPESNDPIVGYQILRRTLNDDEEELSVHDTTSKPATLYTDTEVEHREKYVYRVVALTKDSKGPKSNRTVIKYDDPAYQIPDPPANLDAAVETDGVLLTWDAPSESKYVIGYRVERRRPNVDGEKLTVVIADTGSTDTTVLHSDVVDGERYVYRVAAISKGGVGKRSNRATVTWQDDSEDLTHVNAFWVTVCPPGGQSEDDDAIYCGPGGNIATNLSLDEEDQRQVTYAIRIDIETESGADADECEGRNLGELLEVESDEDGRALSGGDFTSGGGCNAGRYRIVISYGITEETRRHSSSLVLVWR